MGADFIPESDLKARDWMRSFAGGIAAQPAAYGLAPAQAAALVAAIEQFAAALAVARDPNQRTPVNVRIKNDARRSAQHLCRRHARLIKPDAGISDALKIAIGIPPPNPGRSAIFAPASSPLLSILGLTIGGAHRLHFADSLTPDRRAKPPGAAALHLFVQIGPAPLRDPAGARFLGAFGKNPITIPFSPGQGGQFATYFARWASRRGDSGPWSAPRSMRIAA